MYGNERLFHPILRDYGFYPPRGSFDAAWGLFAQGQHQNSPGVDETHNPSRWVGRWGQWPYRQASQYISGLRLEISDPKYQHLQVHIVYMVPYGSLRGHNNPQTASEIKFELRFETRDPITYFSMSILLNGIGPLAAPEATATSKQPRRSNKIWPEIWNESSQLPTYSCGYC